MPGTMLWVCVRVGRVRCPFQHCTCPAYARIHPYVGVSAQACEVVNRCILHNHQTTATHQILACATYPWSIGHSHVKKWHSYVGEFGVAGGPSWVPFLQTHTGPRIRPPQATMAAATGTAAVLCGHWHLKHGAGGGWRWFRRGPKLFAIKVRPRVT